MKLYQKMLTYGALIAGLSGLTGCTKSAGSEEVAPQVAPQPDYFASVALDYARDLRTIKGDFDGDGDLDLIVSARSANNTIGQQGKLYLFLNDGKGNFTLKKPTLPAEKRQDKLTGINLNRDYETAVKLVPETTFALMDLILGDPFQNDKSTGIGLRRDPNNSIPLPDTPVTLEYKFSRQYQTLNKTLNQEDN
ncbi:hypothetical protein GOV03_02360 [Candidatus Woesearchaeota archaeon]|nr:hypothetical protein [Candidatus Woesearchaeota archaeon]